MREAAACALDDVRTVYAACLITLALGLFFTFVWAPHPWDWRGIDQYHQLAQELARGEPFATTDVPWGYAYFVAAFYALFGPHPWIPVTAQVMVNAFAPLFLYRLVRPLTTMRVAVASALLTGLLSFNTVYASMQSSDAICTVLFIVMVLWFERAGVSQRWRLFVLAGVLAGLVPQFRPNMILFPPLLAAAYVLRRGVRVEKAAQAGVFLAVFALTLLPWTVRNYSLTGTFMPTSTHGGVQLWYGTLQVGEHLESRAHNPRSVFEASTFPYTSIADRPIIVSATLREAAPESRTQVILRYYTDRDRTLYSVHPARIEGRTYTFHLPAQPSPTAVYFHFSAQWAGPDGAMQRQVIPVDAARDPYIVFVDDRHLADLDRHAELLDVFDIARIVQHVAWRTPLANTATVDFDGNGRVERADLVRGVAALLGSPPDDVSAVRELSVTNRAAMLRLADHSTLYIPRREIARVTELLPSGGYAAILTHTWRSFAGLAIAAATPPGTRPPACCVIGDVRINEVFYRREPHMMRRYLALAFDNITRDPGAFAAASAYRLVRLFVIRGSNDHWTAYQFRASTLVYTLGTALSLANLVAFLAGLWISWRRRYAVLPLALAVAYVPLTICFVLTNMRYTITVQPFMFVFVAIALLAASRLDAPRSFADDAEVAGRRQRAV